jgi:dsRNA-specific ribonuclease
VTAILEAITPASCQEDVSYERLENLGDAFLKYAASVHVFLAHPQVRQLRR